MSEQPEALRLAELIRSRYGNDINDEAAAELRRLHEENFALAAHQCLYRDGSGLTGDEGGTPVCMKDRTIQELVTVLKQCDEAMTWELGGEPLPTLMIAARTAARAAIAKAEGETK